MFKKWIGLAMLLGSLSQAFACPSAPFTARNGKGEAVARLQGSRILSSGWTVYSRGATEDYTITRYKSPTGNRHALWLYEAIDPGHQPGIIWGVWYDAGMFEGFVNRYQIQTNVRGGLQPREAKLTLDPDTGVYTVHCG